MNDEERRFDGYWHARSEYLKNNRAKDSSQCEHKDSYDTESWSRCLSCCYVIPRPAQPAEPTDLEKRELYVEYLMASGRIKRYG